MFPGAITPANATRDHPRQQPLSRLRVVNTSDRAVSIGSHCHFCEVDVGLSFDREAARGYHLNIAAGTMLRFEPGQVREVELVPFEGARLTFGFADELPWPLED
jgi:urease beta subunit